jgi:hypothetical protein
MPATRLGGVGLGIRSYGAPARGGDGRTGGRLPVAGLLDDALAAANAPAEPASSDAAPDVVVG